MHVFGHFHKELFIEGVAKESSYSGHGKRSNYSGCGKRIQLCIVDMFETCFKIFLWILVYRRFFPTAVMVLSTRLRTMCTSLLGLGVRGSQTVPMVSHSSSPAPPDERPYPLLSSLFIFGQDLVFGVLVF